MTVSFLKFCFVFLFGILDFLPGFFHVFNFLTPISIYFSVRYCLHGQFSSDLMTRIHSPTRVKQPLHGHRAGAV